MTRPQPYSSDVEEAAALWFARMASELRTPADEVAFDSWLAEAPEHSEAYAEFCALNDRFAVLEGNPQIAEYRVEAQLIEERARRPSWTRLGLIGTSMVAAASAWALFLIGDFSRLSVKPPESLTVQAEIQKFSTARGEIREIVLSDGSRATLGSDTRLDIMFRNNQRLVNISRGQVFFDVAHDAGRPFVAAAGDRMVTALGTQFDVRFFPNDLTVTLLGGHVRIAERGEGQKAVLDPGQQFRSSFGVTSIRDVDAAAEVSWRTGILEFDDIPLSEAVSRFNQSAKIAIVLADPSLGEYRVSGVFRSDNPTGFARALAPVYPVRVQQQTSGDVILTRSKSLS